MPTKDQLQDILSTLYVKILGYGDDSYAQSIKARKEYLSELVEMLYETKPDEVISRVLEFEREVCREEDLFNYREMLERNFNNIFGKYNDLCDTGQYDTRFMDKNRHLPFDEVPAMLRSARTKEEMGSIFQRYVAELKTSYQELSQK